MLTAAPPEAGTLHVRPATRADDAALRSLLNEQSMSDATPVRLEREPSLFDALDGDGSSHRIAVAEDAETGALRGMGVRSVRTVFVNGEPCLRGYLHLMRVRRTPRVLRAMLTQGYALLGSSGAGADYTTIMSDNAPAARLLTRGHRDLPAYRPLDALTTCVLRARRRRMPRGVRAATPGDYNAIVALVNRWNRGFQFMPQLAAGDLQRRGGDWLVREIDGRIGAACAVWDQRSAKQIIIGADAAPGALARRGINVLARVRGLPAVPRAETPLPVGMIAHLGIEHDRLDVFESLLQGALANAAARGLTCAAVIASARNPIYPQLMKRPAIRLRSRVYAVVWNGAGEVLDGRPAQVESSLA